MFIITMKNFILVSVTNIVQLLKRFKVNKVQTDNNQHLKCKKKKNHIYTRALMVSKRKERVRVSE